ncbi:hypothetical protein Pfo_027146 [Paulownia fortunei]|nr:hypothetical protein Pfo_027146 [Paulownia fortunei]
MNYTMIKYLLSFLILSSNLLQTKALDKRQCFFIKKRIVHVVNNLPSKSSPLLLHCASGDDDLGYHTLTTNQDFHFDFCVKPSATLFFCRLTWNQKTIRFDAFNANWAYDRCGYGVCYYAARSDGIYFSDIYPPRDPTKLYSW